ncbi:hypothetical protein [uncultured Psychromonas sp.]|uniref:DUF6414 family protein n=1 Tax=uncultured Psychromonas sp. TaxID=173974 RepID=UPI0026045FEA|nr:hypothetical protein [uncultured Psychromonas sp.]
MESIKSFLYLDKDKMYSISSQLFEGLTEYVIHSQKENVDTSEEQKGPMASGRVLAEILSKGEESQSKKFLHDYSYTLFEKELMSKSKILNIDEHSISTVIKDVNDYSFIKIKGKAVFRDTKQITDTLKEYNEIGKSMAHVTNFAKISSAKEEALEMLKVTTNNKQKAEIKTKLKEITDVNAIARESGLILDQEFCNDLAFLLDYGYSDSFEVQITLDNILFSAPLTRSDLKENEKSLIAKYSRSTEKEFVIFGLICQSESEQKIEPKTEVQSESSEGIKVALKSFVSALTEVERSFTGKLDNEIIIDPIAVYREL